jgi:N-acetylglutamate synthase-like GNAT family acetyltransferase
MRIGLLENPEVPGPLPDIQKVYHALGKDFEELTEQIKKSVKRGILCHGDVHHKYVRFKIKRSPYLLFLLDTKGALLGFAAISFMFPKVIRLEVICSKPNTKGVGTMLIAAVERIAALAGAPKIIVKSLQSAIGFYIKLGFTQETEIKLPMSDVEKEYGRVKYMVLSKKVGRHTRRRQRPHIRSRRTLRASQK